MNILITGGASGLGKEITLALTENQSNKVYFTYNSSEFAAKEIESKHSNSKAIRCDFTNEEQVNSLANSFELLNLDVIINNAFCGIYEMAHYHKINIESFKKDFENNVLPVIKLNQEVIKVFRKKKSGKIITVLTSYLSGLPPAGMSAYLASKAYLKQLTKVWAVENIKFNISSNTISPSFMQTELNNSVDERVIEQMVAQHPLKKLLTPKEVAMVIESMTRYSIHVNGIDVTLDAGA